jgi:hypothetical protein
MAKLNPRYLLLPVAIRERQERFLNSWSVDMYEGDEWRCAKCSCSPFSCSCPTYKPIGEVS